MLCGALLQGGFSRSSTARLLPCHFLPRRARSSRAPPRDARPSVAVQVRRAVWSGEPTKLSRSIGFLTEEFDKSYFGWELVEVVKKLVLVGLMSVVMPGSLNQLVLAFVIVLCFLVALLVARPYKRPECGAPASSSCPPQAHESARSRAQPLSPRRARRAGTTSSRLLLALGS